MKSVQIQLTTLCNEKCIFCRKYTWLKKHIDFDILKQKIEQYEGATFQFSGGEPLMYNNLKKLVKLLIEKQIIYKVYTNMSFKLNKIQKQFLDNASQISISLDGMDEATYNEIRRPTNTSAFTYVISNIKLYKEKSRVCTVLTNKNYNQVKQFIQFCINNKLQGRLYNVHTNLENSLNVQQRLEILKIMQQYRNCEYINAKGFTFASNPNFIECNVRNYHRVIDEDGREYTCCYAINDNGEDIDGKYQIKNLPDLNPSTIYDYCCKCTRYKKANENWKNIKNQKIVFL